MRTTLLVLSVILLASVMILFAVPNPRQEKPGSTEPKMTPEDIAKKNPVPPTQEGTAGARKIYGYNCAMCHDKNGDGKGELAVDMKLELRDWRDPASLEKMTDGELFWIITNGKGKMPGEGDRSTDKVRWNMVNLVRSFSK
jgi:mono/diheme cytochrome c family protein